MQYKQNFSFKILTELRLQNLDQTSATGLVWQDSVRQGKERLQNFWRSSHARVTSVKSQQTDNLQSYDGQWQGDARTWVS